MLVNNKDYQLNIVLFAVLNLRFYMRSSFLTYIYASSEL